MRQSSETGWENGGSCCGIEKNHELQRNNLYLHDLFVSALCAVSTYKKHVLLEQLTALTEANTP
jgi:hypothetical protein